MADDSDHDLTALLERARAGDRAAGERLMPAMEAALRRQAAAVRRGRPGHPSLETTGLIDEVVVRLLRRDAPWESRAHFMNVAAKAMRTILVDHARSRGRLRRGGDRQRVPLDDALAWYEENHLDVVALNDALDELARLDPRKAELVHLKFFAGRTHEECAALLGLSVATVERQWGVTRAWLLTRLGGSEPRAGDSDARAPRG